MSSSAASGLGQLLDIEALPEWIQQQRWYASKSRSISALEIVESLPLREHPPLLLTLAQKFVADSTGGWELAPDRIRSDAEWFLGQLGSLGVVTALLHTVLASDASDPAFAAEEPSHEAI